MNYEKIVTLYDTAEHAEAARAESGISRALRPARSA